jgi:hypothetical protein
MLTPLWQEHFVEVIESFPQECQKVLDSFQKIHHHDAQAKERRLSDQERLLSTESLRQRCVIARIPRQ